MEINLLIRLLVAHVLADFIFQPNCLVKLKTHPNLIKRHEGLFLHSFIHALTAYVIIAQWKETLIPILILFTHYAIDFWKKDRKGVRVFIVDQTLHILAIVLICFFYFHLDFSIISQIYERVAHSNKFWLILLAYLLVTRPSSIFIGKVVERWSEENTSQDGLDKAGQWIGYVERMLILTFILAGNCAGIGWLLAAKSIFRFGDLNHARNIKKTEYVLIGTLLSFFVAIATGYILTNAI